MLLSDLLSKDVRCAGEHLGCVVDVRFVVRGRVEGVIAQAELVGLIVGPRAGIAFLGYERNRMNRPVLLNRFLAWRQRGSFLVDWVDVEEIGDHVTIRPGCQRWSARASGTA